MGEVSDPFHVSRECKRQVAETSPCRKGGAPARLRLSEFSDQASLLPSSILRERRPGRALPFQSVSSPTRDTLRTDRDNGGGRAGERSPFTDGLLGARGGQSHLFPTLPGATPPHLCHRGAGITAWSPPLPPAPMAKALPGTDLGPGVTEGRGRKGGGGGGP